MHLRAAQHRACAGLGLGLRLSNPNLNRNRVTVTLARACARLLARAVELLLDVQREHGMRPDRVRVVVRGRVSY